MKTWYELGIEINTSGGNEQKTTCPQCSASRKKSSTKCLNVNLDKELFNCWHCGWGGTLKTGTRDKADPYKYVPKVFAKPQPIDGELPERVTEWFAKRGIPKSVLNRNLIAYGPVYMPQLEAETDAIQFPFLRKGEIVNVKYRDNKKNFRMYSGAERIFYGLDDVDPECVILVEGEIDKLSFEAAGFLSVLSVPDGAPAVTAKNYDSKFEFMDSAADLLSTVKKFILAVDNDEPGMKLEAELARRLGKDKCFRVKWPEGCKDANDTLIKLGPEKIHAVIEAASAFPIEGVFGVSDLRADLMAFYDAGMRPGVSTGFPSLDELYRVRPGEWTIITGIPGHGKSEFLDQIALNLIRQHGWAFGICSPENQPIARHISKYIQRLMDKPFAGKRKMQRLEVEGAAEILENYLKFILPEDDCTLDGILTRGSALVRRYGIRALIIDPWSELEHKRPREQTEGEYISDSLSKIRKWGRKHDAHVFLVAHPTKMQRSADGSYPVPRPYDISGTAHWFNKADNAIAVWRDVLNPAEPVQIHIQKIKFEENGRPGRAELMFQRDTRVYIDPQEAPNPQRGLYDQ